ncbi:MAG: hypothetical protein CM15mP89_0440 [Gammaproteobacteria bacterium]|nr:MAG: hypothetical protein CM15mP89_0440 [Gammaproteobacteria bacterium]
MRFRAAWLRGQFQQFTSAPVSDSAAALQTSLERELRIDIWTSGLATGERAVAERAAPPDRRRIGAWMRQLHVSVEGIHRADTELGDLDLTIDYVAGEGWQFREVTAIFWASIGYPKQGCLAVRRGEGVDYAVTAAELEICHTLALIGVAPLVETSAAGWMLIGNGRAVPPILS